jgi:translation initiation factor IF-3
VNDKIIASVVRAIDDSGEQLGIIPVKEVLAIAQDRGLDLVEVAPNAKPPVCRIMDYGRYKYQQEKRATESKKKQSQITIKEIKLRPKTGEHDYQTKVKHILKFLDKGNKVKVTIMFRGREIVHSDIGMRILNRIAEELNESAQVENHPKLEGRNMSMLLSPRKE